MDGTDGHGLLPSLSLSVRRTTGDMLMRFSQLRMKRGLAQKAVRRWSVGQRGTGKREREQAQRWESAGSDTGGCRQ